MFEHSDLLRYFTVLYLKFLHYFTDNGIGMIAEQLLQCLIHVEHCQVATLLKLQRMMTGVTEIHDNHCLRIVRVVWANSAFYPFKVGEV